MFSSNSFGALAMDEEKQPDPSAGPSQRLVEGDEVDADWLELVRTNRDTNVQVNDKIDLAGLPNEACLLAISNAKGLLFAGGNNDVRVHNLSSVHKLFEDSPKGSAPSSTPVQAIALPARPVWVRLAGGDEYLVVATLGGGVLLYKTSDIVNGNTQPYASVTSGIPDHLLDVLPNPAAPSPTDKLSNYVLLLAQEGFVMVDLESGNLSPPLSGPFTAACWSVKGKQVVVGSPDGNLVQYTPEGQAKAAILPPNDLPGHYPAFVQWLENDLFLVGYAPSGADVADALEIVVIHRTKTDVTYTKFYDVNNTMGYAGRSSLFRHFAGLHSWNDSRHLAFLISPMSSEIGILRGKPAADKTAPEWEALILEETSRGVLPAAKAGSGEDEMSPLGLAFDLTSTKVIRQGIVGGEELPDLAPAPRVIAYSQEGFILSFDVKNLDGGPYPGMQGAVGSAATVPATPAQPAQPQTSTASGFGQSTFGQSPFGATNKPSAFSSTPSTSPAKAAFGSTTPIGAPSAPAFGSSAFGQSSTPKPAFGSSTFGSPATSAFGQPASSPSAFGQSSFGQSSGSTSAFGQSAFGKKEGDQPTSAFGSSSTSSAFGQSAFGQSAFGKDDSKPSAFGQSAFGKKDDSKASAFGQSSFGSTTSGSAFGQSAFGQPAASGSAFGSSPSSGSAFGSSPAAGSAFSGFGQKATPPSGSAPASAFGSSAFGSSSGSAFGKPADKPAESAFGKSSFGQSSGSAFAGFGKQTTPQSNPFAIKSDEASSPKVEQKSTGDAFGLGSLDSSLSTTSKKPSGLEDSPPNSPTHKPGKVPGLEDDDDSPPSTPRATSTTATSAFTAPPADSPFSKPGSAFGGTSNAFGAFGNKPSGAFGNKPSSSAFGGAAFGSTPAALSATPETSKPSTPSSSIAFGQSSTMTGSAFGKSSTPSAAFGTISGGFGGFAAKDDKKDTALGGFSAFAAKGDGAASVFGDKPSAISFGQKDNSTKDADGSKEAKPADTEPVETVTKPAKKATFSFGDSEGAEPDKPEPGQPAPKPEAPEIETPKPVVEPPTEETVHDDNTIEVTEVSESDAAPGAEDEAEEVVEEEYDDYDYGEDEEEYDEEEYEEEDYEEEEEEEFDEEEEHGDGEDEHDEDDEDGELRSRRSFSSLHPDMDTIPEGDETASEEEDEPASTSPSTSPVKRTKSPPWFASDSSSSQPSLLSRIGPVSPQGQGPPVFAHKHAPKTSSPLGAAVTTAEDSPAPSPDSSPGSPIVRAPSPKHVQYTGSGGVGLGLASSPPFSFNNANRGSSNAGSETSDDKEDKKQVEEESTKDASEDSKAPKEATDSAAAKVETPPFTFKQAGPKDDEWECDTCMLKNPATATEKCTVCETPKPGAAPAKASTPSLPKAPPSFSLPKGPANGGFLFGGGKPVTPAPPAPSGPAPLFGSSPAQPFSFGSATPSTDKPYNPKSGDQADGSEWTCDTCMLKNPASATDKCTICEAKRPGAAPAAKPATPLAPPTAPSSGFGFGKPPAAPAAPAAPSAFSGFGKPAAPSGGFGFGSKKDGAKKEDEAKKDETQVSDKPADTPASTTKSGTWTCDTCMLQNPEDAKDKCTICEAPRPGATPKSAPPAAPPAAPSGGFGFGQKPATTTAAASTAASTTASTAASTTASTTASTAAPPAPFSFNKPAAAPSTAAASSTFAWGKPAAAPAAAAPAVPPSASAPTPFSFATKPTSSPAPPAPAPFSFAKPATASPASPAPFSFAKPAGDSSPALGLGKPPAQTPVQGYSEAPPATATPAKEQPPATEQPPAKEQPPATQTFKAPARAAVPPLQQPAPLTANTLAAMLERVVAEAEADVANLKATLKANKEYHAAVESPDFSRPTIDTVGSQTTLPFSTLDDIAAIAADISEQLKTVRAQVGESDIALVELQSRMLKTDMKLGQAARFMKAREDPQFAKAMQIKELNPQQAADQIRLRKVVQMTEARLDELDAGIAGLKRRSKPQQRGPALERIQRSVRNMDVAMRDRQQAIDDLSRRVSGLRLGHSHSRESSLAPEEPPKGQAAARPQAAAAAPKPSVEPTDEMRAAASKAMDNRPKLAKRAEARVTEAGPPNGHRRPVKMDSMPMPGSSAPLFSSTGGYGSASTAKPAKAASQTPTATTASTPPAATSPATSPSATSPPAKPSFGFAGIKLQLDPGSITSSGGGSSRRTNNRAHESAPRLARTPVAVNTTGGGFFGTPNTTTTSNSSKTPAGFFSLSDFGSK